MCLICGCDASGERPGVKIEHSHKHHYGLSHNKSQSDGGEASRLIEVERSILSKNDIYAANNRTWFETNGNLALNLVSSPGAGKTTLLVETINAMSGKHTIGVIEGDQETANDADRIRETGVSAVQINTGSGCHLDAHMVGHAVEDLPAMSDAILFVENVGNLVCPASFDLGERAKVVILSSTEGDDKPLKYPDMFAAADVIVLSKIDLLPYVDFNADKAIENALAINPNLTCIRVSSKTGDGMENWINWIEGEAAKVSATRAAGPSAVASLDHHDA
jgi:hydrogenase nickel incorporation protein HypB